MSLAGTVGGARSVQLTLGQVVGEVVCREAMQRRSGRHAGATSATERSPRTARGEKMRNTKRGDTSADEDRITNSRAHAACLQDSADMEAAA